MGTKDVCHLIGSESMSSQETLNNVNPATGEVVGQVPIAGWAEVERAVQAAEKVWPAWSHSSLETRSQLLLKLADLIDRDRALLARLESVDSGKPYKRSLELEIPRVAQNFRFFAHALFEIKGESFWNHDQHLHYTQRHPLGVVGIISPWNLPLILLSWKMAPALATGNAVVAKPSELTARSAQHLGQLILEAGFAPGLVNILHGPASTGEALVAHPRVKAISFTGGTKTGKAIASICAPMLKKVSLELGGKNATILFASSNLERSIPEIVRAGFANSGQICLCGSRVLIEDSIYDRAKHMMVEEIKKLVMGDPFDARTDLGPVISEAHLHKIQGAISTVDVDGGRILVGGHRSKLAGPFANGSFFEPTLVEALSEQSELNQEEVFGPVVSLLRFANEEQAIKIANNTKYGLSASIWTENLGQAHRLAQAMQTGMVYVNCWMKRDLRTPFGGIKNSGLGREGGRYALEFFTEALSTTVYQGF